MATVTKRDEVLFVIASRVSLEHGLDLLDALQSVDNCSRCPLAPRLQPRAMVTL
jgi:hypothetical protein